ncbi:MAG: hypothetical protein LBB74_06760 [Chitinispirillales bacterium]|jgi:hypothetical protein|nr:hypothetical protein [Chitinispirillales bacterium]
MTTLVIDRQTLPEPLLSLIGGAPRVLASQRYDGGDIVLTPATEGDGPDSEYINPDDYPDETAYLNALPGVAERLIKSMNAPASEFEPASRESFNV